MMICTHTYTHTHTHSLSLSLSLLLSLSHFPRTHIRTSANHSSLRPPPCTHTCDLVQVRIQRLWPFRSLAAAQQDESNRDRGERSDRSTSSIDTLHVRESIPHTNSSCHSRFFIGSFPYVRAHSGLSGTRTVRCLKSESYTNKVFHACFNCRVL